MSKRKLNEITEDNKCKLEYMYNPIIFLKTLKYLRLELESDKKSIETYIYLKELSNLYNKFLEDRDNEVLKQTIVKKIREKTTVEWDNIIKFQLHRQKVFSKKKYEKFDFNELKLIEELQGLQSGDEFAFDEIGEKCIKYLSTISTLARGNKTKKRKKKIETNKKKLRKQITQKLKAKSKLKKVKTRSKPKNKKI